MPDESPTESKAAHTPGPFYAEGGYLYRRGQHPNHVDTWCYLGGMNATEAAVLVRLLNAGAAAPATKRQRDMLLRVLKRAVNDAEGINAGLEIALCAGHLESWQAAIRACEESGL